MVPLPRLGGRSGLISPSGKGIQTAPPRAGRQHPPLPSHRRVPPPGYRRVSGLGIARAGGLGGLGASQTRPHTMHTGRMAGCRTGFAMVTEGRRLGEG